MMSNVAIAMLFAFGWMAGFLAIAGIGEYVAFPIWDWIKELIAK